LSKRSARTRSIEPLIAEEVGSHFGLRPAAIIHNLILRRSI
jgi:hypothetical protein